MAKSNCPAEDSAPPQASAGQLTPRFLPLSLSGRLLQVTVAISPSAAKGASKGAGFLGSSDRKVPAGKCRISKGGVKGELQRRKSSSLVVCFCRLGRGYLLPGEFPSRYVFKRCICRGTFCLEQNQKTAKRLSRTPFSVGIWVVEVTSE